MPSRLKSVVTFIFLIHLNVLAHTEANCDLYSVDGFVPIKELADVLTAQSASVSIKFLLKNGQWENCSGAVVSDRGHIMTAGHCFENCSSSNEEKPNPYAAYNSYGAYTGAKKERPSKCIAKIDGVETPVDIKLTSECSFEEHQVVAGTHPPQKCTRFNEVAVVLPQSQIPSKSCLPLATNFKEGDRVYTIGYPSKTERGNQDSDGESQYASFGKIIPYSQKCKMLQNSWDMDKLNKIDQPGDVTDLVFVNPGMKYSAIQTTVDAVPGNSGGPLINEKGEIIAVASFGETQKNNEYKQCKGSTFFSPIAGISSELSHFSSDFKMSDLVCEKQKVK